MWTSETLEQQRLGWYLGSASSISQVGNLQGSRGGHVLVPHALRRFGLLAQGCHRSLTWSVLQGQMQLLQALPRDGSPRWSCPCSWYTLSVLVGHS